MEPMKGIQVRRGAILLWRLGKLEYGEQSAWDRAPQARGMWAFPWPYWSEDFTYHQYNYYMPKRLQINDYGCPVDPANFQYPDGSRPAVVEVDETGYPEDELLNVRPSFWTDRHAWVATTGSRVLPLRKFWYEGELYTHFSARGVKFYSHGLAMYALEDWHRVDTVEVARRLRKGTGQLALPEESRRRVARRGSVGLLELFLPPGAGRIS